MLCPPWPRLPPHRVARPVAHVSIHEDVELGAHVLAHKLHLVGLEVDIRHDAFRSDLASVLVAAAAGISSGQK